MGGSTLVDTMRLCSDRPAPLLGAAENSLFVTSRTRHRLWAARLAVGFNVAVTFGCAVLIASAPTRAGAFLAAAGLVFFGLAAVGFALMLRIATR